MRSEIRLPDGYHEIDRIDLQENRRLGFRIGLAAVALAVLMIAVTAVFVPLTELFSPLVGIRLYIARLLALVLGAAAYALLHELMEGYLLRRFGSVKETYHMSLLSPSVGSNAYFDKKRYLLIVLMPTVFWTVVLTAACCFVPRSWFWVAYLIQVFNLSGAVGDFYLCFRLSRLPLDILIQDSGTQVRVYSRTEKLEKRPK